MLIFFRSFVHAFNTELEKSKALCLIWHNGPLQSCCILNSHSFDRNMIPKWLGMALVGSKFNPRLSSVSSVKITQIKSIRSPLMKTLLGHQNLSDFISTKISYIE